MTERGRQVTSGLAIAVLLMVVWLVIEWRSAAPPPPQVELPYPPAPAGPQ